MGEDSYRCRIADGPNPKLHRTGHWNFFSFLIAGHWNLDKKLENMWPGSDKDDRSLLSWSCQSTQQGSQQTKGKKLKDVQGHSVIKVTQDLLTHHISTILPLIIKWQRFSLLRALDWNVWTKYVKRILLKKWYVKIIKKQWKHWDLGLKIVSPSCK